jgi:hypothetical protein
MRTPFLPLALTLTLACGGKAASTPEDRLNAWLRSQYPEGHDSTASNSELGVTGDEEMMGRMATPVFPSGFVSPSVSVPSSTPVASFCIGFGDPAAAWCIPADHADVRLAGVSSRVSAAAHAPAPSLGGDPVGWLSQRLRRSSRPSPDTASGGDSGSSDTGSGDTGGGSGGDGTVGLALTLPADLCDDLGELCHQIKCYEFAETSAGTFTAANIEYLAAACGNCDEPSCQELIHECSVDGFCITDADCPEDDEICSSGTCVREGALRFTASWSALSDVDLHVLTPGGTELYYANPTGDGGVQDVDNTWGGTNAIENIYFDAPAAGTYTYWVVLYSGDPAAWSLAVHEGATSSATQSGSLSAVGDESDHFSFDFSGAP